MDELFRMIGRSDEPELKALVRRHEGNVAMDSSGGYMKGRDELTREERRYIEEGARKILDGDSGEVGKAAMDADDLDPEYKAARWGMVWKDRYDAAKADESRICASAEMQMRKRSQELNKHGLH